MRRRRALVLAPLAWAAAALGSGPAGAALPAGELRVVVPVEPGGGMDAMARLITHQWASGQQVWAVVINRAGASGNIGTASVARSRADGQTLLLTGVSHLTSPMLHGNAGYDPIEDFAPVARLATTPTVLLVSDALKGMGLAQILQDPRSRGTWSFGSAGYGHSSHLAAEVFMARTGAKWLHVPYKGNGPALRALMAGEVQIQFLSATSVVAALATGKVHPVGVAHRERLDNLPHIPTFRELGVRDAEFTQWYGLLAPRDTPLAAVRALSDIALDAVRSAGVAAQLQAQGVDADPLDHEEFARFLVAEQRRLEILLRKQGVERPGGLK